MYIHTKTNTHTYSHMTTFIHDVLYIFHALSDGCLWSVLFTELTEVQKSWWKLNYRAKHISEVPGSAGSAGFKSPAWLSISTWALSVAWLGVNPHYEGSLSAPVLTNKSDTFSAKYRHKNTAAILLELCFISLSWHNQPTNYIIIHLSLILLFSIN